MTTSLHNLIQGHPQALNTASTSTSVLVQPQQTLTGNVDELTSVFRPMRPTTEEVTTTLEAVLLEMVDDITLGMIFDVHRAVKKGFFLLSDTDDESLKQFEIIDRPGFDIFGQLPPSRGRCGNGTSGSSGTSGNLNHQYECPCPNCGRTMAVSRFAPHLEKCMIGLGRTSGRIASRRLADLGAFLFADRSTSSASSDTASSASRSSLGEDDFEWTVNGPKGNAGGSRGVKRARAAVQRKQMTAPAQPLLPDYNGSQAAMATAPLPMDSRLAAPLPPPSTPPTGSASRRQTGGGGSKRSRQAKTKLAEPAPINNKPGISDLESSYSRVVSTTTTKLQQPSLVNSACISNPATTTGNNSRSVGNVFESLAAEMLSVSNSSSGSSSHKGRLT